MKRLDKFPHTVEVPNVSLTFEMNASGLLEQAQEL